MKAYFKYLMIFPLLFALAACDDNKQSTNATDETVTVTEEVVPQDTAPNATVDQAAPDANATLNATATPDATQPATDATQPNAAPAAGASQNAVDWAGSYRGVIPCPDCDGVEMVLTLQPDNSFVLLSKYLGKSDEALRDQGALTWSDDGSTITIESNGAKRLFKVGEGQLFLLDEAGNRVEGDKADQYILIKQQD